MRVRHSGVFKTLIEVLQLNLRFVVVTTAGKQNITEYNERSRMETNQKFLSLLRLLNTVVISSRSIVAIL